MDEVSAAQAAVLTGLSERTIRRKIASGTLPARRIAPNRFAIAVRDLPRRREVNELVRRLEALEQRIALLEEQQRMLAPQLSWEAVATGAEISALANGTEGGGAAGDLTQVLVQLAREVERLTPLLAPGAGETNQNGDASSHNSGTEATEAWLGGLSDNAG